MHLTAQIGRPDSKRADNNPGIVMRDVRDIRRRRVRDRIVAWKHPCSASGGRIDSLLGGGAVTRRVEDPIVDPLASSAETLR